MIVEINETERWPDYKIERVVGDGHDFGWHRVEVSDETVERWERAIAAYRAVQREIAVVYERS